MKQSNVENCFDSDSNESELFSNRRTKKEPTNINKQTRSKYTLDGLATKEEVAFVTDHKKSTNFIPGTSFDAKEKSDLDSDNNSEQSIHLRVRPPSVTKTTESTINIQSMDMEVSADFVANRVELYKQTKKKVITVKKTSSLITKSKSDLINEILSQKCSALKNSKSNKPSLITTSKSDLINEILSKKRSALKKSNLGTRTTSLTTNIENELETSDNTDNSDVENPNATPRISQLKLLKLLNELKAKEKISTQSQHINLCVKGMNRFCANRPRMNSLALLTRAIRESLLARKWNNVTNLLILLIQRTTDTSYVGYIRKIMEIIQHLNPLLRHTTLKNDIQTIMDSSLKRRRQHVKHLPNIV